MDSSKHSVTIPIADYNSLCELAEINSVEKDDTKKLIQEYTRHVARNAEMIAKLTLPATITTESFVVHLDVYSVKIENRVK